MEINKPDQDELERSPEARAYDRTDWPGSSSFHPPHIAEVFRNMNNSSEEPQLPQEFAQPELPFEEK